MRNLAMVFGVLVTLALSAVVAIPVFISADDVFEHVSTEVETTTGRSLTVAGDKRLVLWPSLMVELNQVSFANDSRGSSPNMAQISKLSLHVPWTSVFSGTVIIEKFVIDELQLVLEKHLDGSSNWQLPNSVVGADQHAAPTNDQPAPSTSVPNIPESLDLSLGQVQINGGSLTFRDHQTQTSETVDQLSLELILPSLRKPMTAKGQIRYQQQTFDLRLVLETPIQAIVGETFNTDLHLSSELITATYQGTVAQQPLVVAGELAIAGDSIKQIAQWQGIPMQVKDHAFNQFSVEAAFTFSDNTLDMTTLALKMDELDISGQTRIDLGAVPNIVAEVNLGDLDLNPYLPAVRDPQAPPTTTANSPIVWDDTALDFSGLSSLNADLTITSSSLLARDIKLGANKFTVIIENSQLGLYMNEFNAYQGKGFSHILLNAAQKPYTLQTSFNLSEIAFQPLLTDAIGFDKVLGKGELNWELTTAGTSQKEFVESLNGNISFDVRDGAVQGANVVALVESAKQALSGNFASINLDRNFNSADKTDFAEFTGRLQFAQGVGTARDISLLNPFIRISAEGTIDLPATEVAVLSRARVVNTIEGQGGDMAASGITIPIRIRGPFHDVKVKPDLTTGLKDNLQDKLQQKLQHKLRRIFG